jgi:hypothetical protein
MTDDIKVSTKPASGSDKNKEPEGGGDPLQQAQQWGGGSKGSKGEVTADDRVNEQSSAKR